MISKPENLPKLKRLYLRGFKSIEELDLEFSAMDVLIGPNGAGKSSIIDFLRMVGFMLSSESGLATFVGLAGGASTLLHDGPKRTPQIEANLSVETNRGINDYSFRLGYAAGDSLIFLEEKCRFSDSSRSTPNDRWIEFGAGHRYPLLATAPSGQNLLTKTKTTILKLLRGLSVYQFHDTSHQARIKQKSNTDDNRYLKGDAGNLAPFLFGLRSEASAHYRRIIQTIRLAAPFFEDFVLEPEHGRILLQWREIGSDVVFGPEQMSDGSLRLIALIALLLEPQGKLPPMIVIDEPELGLHPAAIRIVAGAIKALSVTHQCLVATQSQQFLNEFAPENVVVVERNRRSSKVRRLEPEALRTWLDEYALGDLWDMNILGGRPEPMVIG